MITRSFAELLAQQQVSHDRLSAALVGGARQAIAWCDRPASTRSRVALRDAVLASLPDALNVGLPECIVARWWPLQAAAANWQTEPADPLVIQLQLTPCIDLMEHGLPAARVALLATATLTQAGADWQHTGPPAALRVGEARAWLARLELAVLEDLPTGGAPPRRLGFHDQRSSIHLPPGPWRL